MKLLNEEKEMLISRGHIWADLTIDAAPSNGWESSPDDQQQGVEIQQGMVHEPAAKTLHRNGGAGSVVCPAALRATTSRHKAACTIRLHSSRMEHNTEKSRVQDPVSACTAHPPLSQPIKHRPDMHPPCRSTECHFRSAEPNRDPQWYHPSSGDVCNIPRSARAMHNRRICIREEHQAPEILYAMAQS